MQLELRSHERLPPGAGDFWRARLSDQPMSGLAVEWCEALQASSPPRLEFRYYEVLEAERPLALVILHLLRKVDIPRYAGKGMDRLFSALRRLGMAPLDLDVAFLELPLANRPGFFFTEAGLPRAAQVTAAVVERVRQEFRYDLLVLKSNGAGPWESAFRPLGLPTVPFLAINELALPFGDFEAYVQSLSSNNRSSLRRNRKTFAGAGGTVEVSSDFAAHAAAIFGLYRETCAHHRAQGSLEVPIEIGEAYFSALDALPPGHRALFLARAGGALAAFAVTVESGGTLYFTTCGLSYATATASRAYFNLYYAMIEYALGRGLKRICLGPEAYEVKRRVGGQPVPTSYHFEVKNRLFRPVIGALVRNFASQEGSRQGTELG